MLMYHHLSSSPSDASAHMTQSNCFQFIIFFMPFLIMGSSSMMITLNIVPSVASHLTVNSRLPWYTLPVRSQFSNRSCLQKQLDSSVYIFIPILFRGSFPSDLKYKSLSIDNLRFSASSSEFFIPGPESITVIMSLSCLILALNRMSPLPSAFLSRDKQHSQPVAG